MKLGKILRRLRKSQHYTLSEVSETTGLSISFLSDIERGTTRPSLDTLEKLAVCYEIKLSELLGDAGFASETITRTAPPGFEEFKDHLADEGIVLDEDLQDLLLRVERRGSKPAQTKEDWLQRYWTLRGILER